MTTFALSPVDLLNNLKFDKMSIDVSAAKQYLIQAELKHIFLDPESTKLQGSDLIDTYQKWIKQDDIFITIKLQKTFPFERECVNIAKKIEESKNLFAELEYLLRNIDTEEVKKYNVPIIIKGFQCYAKKEPISNLNDTTSIIYFGKDQPLAVLGMVAEKLSRSKFVDIYCDPSTVFVTNLFAEIIETLCVKIIDISVKPSKILSDEEQYQPSYVVDNKCMGKSKGCVAVVTEKSDIDSVIETLVGASHNYRYPWCLRRVIVQESVYRSFQTTLSHKAQRSCSGTAAASAAACAASAAASSHHVIEGKTFLTEYVGADDTGTAPVVLVEPYRTTKELLSLLHKYKHNYLSLWCTDVSVSNEITFGSKALNVAINDYGVYEGSKDFYDIYQATFYSFWGSEVLDMESEDGNTFSDALSAATKEVSELRNGWLKIDIHERFDKVKKVILIAEEKNIISKDSSSDKFKQVESVSWVDVEKSKLTIGMTEPCGVLYIEDYAAIVSQHLLSILHSIIRGNGVVINAQMDSINYFNIEILIDLFNYHKIPIKSVSNGSYRNKKIKNISDIDCVILNCLTESSLYNKKVVWSRFGETFAN